MSLSYPLSMPTTGVRSIRIRRRSQVGVNISPYTRQRQAYVWPAMWWEAEITLAPLKRAAAEPWVAFLTGLNGMEGTFLLGDTANTSPRGSASGSVLVKGGSQTGRELIVDGLATGVTGIFKEGDWLQLSSGSTSHLHKVTKDANSNGSGEATLDIWPALRASPADNDAVTISNPKGVFMLTSNDQDWDISEALRYGISFAAMEVVSV